MSDREEPYVFLPLAKWKMLDEQCKKNQNVASAMTQDIEEPVPEVKDESTPTEPVLKSAAAHGKNLTKQYRTIQLEKILRDKYGSQLNKFENLHDLINSAIGQSRRVLKHEEEFFKMLFDVNAASALVNNNSKIFQYYPGFWFKA